MEDTRKIATKYRLTHWAEIMQRRVSSGKSIKGFCQMEGIHQNVYFYWQRRLREAACAEIAKSQGVGNELVPGGWTRLAENTPAVAVPGSLSIEVGGCRIEVTTETDPELVAKICRALRSL